MTESGMLSLFGCARCITGFLQRIAGIAILGLILAFVFYFAVDLPAMQATALHVPVNS
ncbi:MAG: hypothetical protein STSR0009_27030 [Methanoregula sp.]